MKMLVPSVSLLSYCLHPILLTPFHGKLKQGFHRCQWLPPILSVKAIAYALSQHSGIHLSVLNQAGIESSDSFASVTNAPPSGVWSTSQSFNHWILLRIPQTRLDLPDSLECRHQFSPIPRRLWSHGMVGSFVRRALGCQAINHASCNQESKRYSLEPWSLVEQEWLSVTLFMGENDDECHGSSHSSSWRTSDILEQEQAELNRRTIVIALILEVQQSSTP